MCYTSVDLARQYLQTNGKSIFQFSELTAIFLNNSAVELMQAWSGRHLC